MHERLRDRVGNLPKVVLHRGVRIHRHAERCPLVSGKLARRGEQFTRQFLHQRRAEQLDDFAVVHAVRRATQGFHLLMQPEFLTEHFEGGEDRGAPQGGHEVHAARARVAEFLRNGLNSDAYQGD